MALEPQAATVEEGPNPELADMSRRFWISLALSVPVSCSPWPTCFPAIRSTARPSRAIVQCDRIRAGATSCCGAAGHFSARLGVHRQSQPEHVHPDRARRRRGVLVQRRRRLFPGVFPPYFARKADKWPCTSKRRRSSPRWCCSARCLELARAARPSAAIKSLLGLAPKTARVVRDDGMEDDVPLDGGAAGRPAARSARRASAGGWVVLEGASAVDESMVTGEAMPVRRRPASA